MPFTLKNNVAFVSGSSRGIGLSIATLFAAAGATVCINGRNGKTVQTLVKEFKEKGYTAEGFPADVSKEEDVKRCVADVTKQFGVVDILVNNAGQSTGRLFEGMSLSEWEQDISENLTSAFLLSRAIISSMKERQKGKIIFISSTSGIRGRKGGAHYIAAKSGLLGLTKALAHELGPFNIQVNAIAPGLTDTDLSRQTYADDFFYSIARQTPLGRIAQPDDIARVALFLASPLSDFMTGQTLIVDGGFTMR